MMKELVRTPDGVEATVEVNVSLGDVGDGKHVEVAFGDGRRLLMTRHEWLFLGEVAARGAAAYLESHGTQRRIDAMRAEATAKAWAEMEALVRHRRGEADRERERTDLDRPVALGADAEATRSAAEELRPHWVSWWKCAEGPGFEWRGPWWVLGSREDGAHSIVAAVMARDEDGAKARIAAAYDRPGVSIEWRFAEQRRPGWEPFSDRFKRAAWMVWPYPGREARSATREVSDGE